MKKIRLKRHRYKRQIRLIIGSTLCLLIIMTAGYAAFSTNITLNTKGNVKDEKHIYVSSSGSDSEGKGTINSPYATIQKAYNAAPLSTSNIIYIMSNITQTGTINMSSNKDITLTSCTKSGSTCTYSVPNSIIRGNSLTNEVLNISNGNLELNNIIIDGDHVEANRALILSGSENLINISIESETTIKNGVNITSDPEYSGGGIIIGGNTILTLNGGEISGNSSIWGAGIKTSAALSTVSNSKIILNNGKIINNSGNYGGGINGCVEINGGVVSGNSAINGGGIVTARTCVITGGTISNNIATNAGGGIYIINATATMTNGSIINNQANQGGGVIVSSSGTFNISGGNILNNTASSTSNGVYVHPDGTYNNTGGNVQSD